MSSQVIPADKRYRISLLLDAYGDLLTAKQRTFLRHYYEEDLSFGEIARDYGVSRQAIFDSVKHGEASLEEFEKVMRLVESGWLRMTDSGLTPDALTEMLDGLRRKIEAIADGTVRRDLLAQLEVILDKFRNESVSMSSSPTP